MPEKETLERARRDERQGKSASTQAGEFVREEIHHVREGKHGARSTKQAIAIGLSKARRAGVDLPASSSASPETRQSAAHDTQTGKRHTKPSRRRSQAMRKRLRREPHAAASKQALSRHAKTVARRRPASARSASARKTARTRKRTQA